MLVDRVRIELTASILQGSTAPQCPAHEIYKLSTDRAFSGATLLLLETSPPILGALQATVRYMRFDKN